MSSSAEEKNANVGFALLVVLGAGASTGIGAAVVFIPSLVKLASRRVLASSLGFSAGVMTFVSFVEIFFKSNGSFVDAGISEKLAFTYATLCFFGGVVTMMILNKMVDLLLGGKHSHSHDHADFPKATQQLTRSTVDKGLVEGVDGTPPCCSTDPVKQLEDVQRMAGVIEGEQNPEGGKTRSIEEKKIQMVDVNAENVEAVVEAEAEEKKSLQKMGLNTALAIGLHNFPEGLATFVATLQDPRVGAILGIAIAIHNIPEGLCVALPIYYSSGSRIKGFMWGLLSGASEFVAALLGWAILANVVTDTTYAVLFGLVGGMMVMISMTELLPTAHVYDRNDTVVTYSFIFGMGVMALSLCLLQ